MVFGGRLCRFDALLAAGRVFLDFYRLGSSHVCWAIPVRRALGFVLALACSMKRGSDNVKLSALRHVGTRYMN